MVAPLIPALIAGGSALASAGIAANASGNASAAGAAANQANINSQEQENFLQRQFAERILGIQLSPTQDALGNRSEFIPGIGFVSTPSSAVKTLQDASLREQTQQLTTDATRQREGRGRAAELGRQESSTANALLQQFLRVIQNPQEASELFRILLAQGNQGFEGEQNRQQQRALRQDLRAGGGSGGKILAEFANRAAEGRGDRAQAAKLQSITGADQINQSRQGNAANLFNLFAQRAQNSFGNVPFAPETISAGATALGQNQRGNVLGASQLASFLNQGTPTRSVAQPADFGTAQFVGGAGTALAEFFRNLPQGTSQPSTTSRGLGNASTDPTTRQIDAFGL